MMLPEASVKVSCIVKLPRRMSVDKVCTRQIDLSSVNGCVALRANSLSTSTDVNVTDKVAPETGQYRRPGGLKPSAAVSNDSSIN